MADIWVVLTVVAFFAICVAFVAGCDRLIGSDAETIDHDEALTAEAGSPVGPGDGAVAEVTA
jgi:hypothetical protein